MTPEEIMHAVVATLLHIGDTVIALESAAIEMRIEFDDPDVAAWDQHQAIGRARAMEQAAAVLRTDLSYLPDELREAALKENVEQ